MMPLWALELSEDIWHKPLHEYIKEKPAPPKHVRFNVWDRVQLFCHHLRSELTLKRRKYTGYIKLKTF
jgi:hypothetical protein